jgi:hypothetical protein
MRNYFDRKDILFFGKEQNMKTHHNILNYGSASRDLSARLRAAASGDLWIINHI